MAFLTTSTICLCFLVALLVLGSAAASSATYAVTSSTLSSGGAAASPANYSFTSSVCQRAIGAGGSANYALCSGFWCPAQSMLARLQVFLPLVRR